MDRTFIEYKLIKKREIEHDPIYITYSQDIWNLRKDIYGEDEVAVESCYAVCLDTKGEVTGWYLVSTGGLDFTACDPKVIGKIALGSCAEAIILIHNHPNGKANPSVEDISMTEKVRAVLEICKVSLLDHVIIGENQFYSFADELTHNMEEEVTRSKRNNFKIKH